MKNSVILKKTKTLYLRKVILLRFPVELNISDDKSEIYNAWHSTENVPKSFGELYLQIEELKKLRPLFRISNLSIVSKNSDVFIELIIEDFCNSEEVITKFKKIFTIQEI